MSWGVLKEAYASVRGEQGRSGSLVQLQTLFRRFYRVRSITFGAPLAETPSIRDTFQGDEWLHLEESNEDEFRLGPVTVGMEVLQALENLGIESLTMIHTKFPSRSPELDNLPADPSYLELISSYCPRLQHVELLAVDYATINDAGLAALTAMCPQLQTLRVQWATLVLPPASPDLIPLQLFAKSRGILGLGLNLTVVLACFSALLLRRMMCSTFTCLLDYFLIFLDSDWCSQSTDAQLKNNNNSACASGARCSPARSHTRHISRRLALPPPLPPRFEALRP